MNLEEESPRALKFPKTELRQVHSRGWDTVSSPFFTRLGNARVPSVPLRTREGYLMIGTVIAIGVSAYGGFAIADYNAKKSTTWAAVWWKGVVVSLCFAGFGAITHSMPSCIEYDSGPNGGCIQYDSEGPVGTAEAKAQRIFFNTVAGGTIGMALLAVRCKREGVSIENYDG